MGLSFSVLYLERLDLRILLVILSDDGFGCKGTPSFLSAIVIKFAKEYALKRGHDLQSPFLTLVVASCGVLPHIR